MSDKKLTILGVVAVCMVIWAVAQTRISNKSRIASDKPTYLIQGLETRDIGSIVIGAGENEVTLRRQAGGKFVVVNKDDYPADMKQINDLITRCLDIKTTQFITEKKENHETLGLTEDKARNVVKFFKSDGSLLTGVIIGNAKEAGQGNYVRLITSDKVYVAPEVPWLRSGAIDYIDQELITVARDDIESVTVISPDGKYTLKKKSEGDGFTLENIPAGKKLKDSDSKNVANAIANIRFTDVKKKSEGADESAFDRQYVCRLTDSTVYTLKINRQDNKTYVICQAEFTDTTPVTIKKEGESEEELKKKEAKLLARDNARKFTAEHQGWIYEIAEWKAQNLTKKLSDLLEDGSKAVQPSAGKKQQGEKKPESDISGAEIDGFDAADIEL
jgi:hypothetical protein